MLITINLAISLTSICAKIMKHIIYHSIMDHLNQNNILIENQRNMTLDLITHM